MAVPRCDAMRCDKQGWFSKTTQTRGGYLPTKERKKENDQNVRSIKVCAKHNHPRTNEPKAKTNLKNKTKNKNKNEKQKQKRTWNVAQPANGHCCDGVGGFEGAGAGAFGAGAFGAGAFGAGEQHHAMQVSENNVTTQKTQNTNRHSQPIIQFILFVHRTILVVLVVVVIATATCDYGPC